jgi:hypothetical protein
MGARNHSAFLSQKYGIGTAGSKGVSRYIFSFYFALRSYRLAQVGRDAATLTTAGSGASHSLHHLFRGPCQSKGVVRVDGSHLAQQPRIKWQAQAMVQHGLLECESAFTISIRDWLIMIGDGTGLGG